MSESRWPKATKEKPCPKCGKANRCLIAPDGNAGICWRSGTKEIWRSENASSNGYASDYVGKAHRPKTRKANARSFATREAAIDAVLLKIKRDNPGAEFTKAWDYHVRGGAVAVVVLRFDWQDDKTYRPIHPCNDGWLDGDPDGLLPLYRQNDLPETGPVYLCEGEKAADAAWSIDLPTITSAHGSAAAESSDWSACDGRDVVILPDNDQPGTKYARTVARILVQRGARVKIINLPGLPAGGDIVEFLDAGGTREQIEKLVDETPFVEPSDLIGGPVLVNMATVERKAVEWLWPSRIPMARITLLSGMPDAGKSFFTTDITACITTGSSWPDGSGDAPRGSVLMIVAEDSAQDTIGPRLDAAEADSRKVELLTVVRRINPETGKATESCFTLDDVHNLEAALSRMKDCRLVIIDPIGSFIGGNVDAHRDNETRSVLGPIAAIAEKYDVAVLMVAHVRKAVSSFADDAVLGSRAFTGIARAVWHLSRDKNDRDRRLLLPGKANLCARPDGLAFTIGGTPPRIIWESSPVQMHADDVLVDAGTPGPEPEARRAAEEWLADVLAGGPVASGDLHNPAPGTIRYQAKEADFAWRTIRRAADHLGVRRERDPFTKSFTWRLAKAKNHVVQACCPTSPKGEQHGQHGQQDESIGSHKQKPINPIHVVQEDSVRTTNNTEFEEVRV